MSFLIESDTVLECPASTDHLGGSLGLTARERAVWIRPVELSSMLLAAATMGSIAARPCNQRQHNLQLPTLIQQGFYFSRVPTPEPCMFLSILHQSIQIVFSQKKMCVMKKECNDILVFIANAHLLQFESTINIFLLLTSFVKIMTIKVIAK